jgi:hypothetical protein
MQFDMSEFADNPVELWQYRAWNPSIRAASREIAYGANNGILFPGDSVKFNESNQAICYFQ